MTIDLPALISSIFQVLLVGLLFGAGLPALYAIGMRALSVGREAPEGAGALAAPGTVSVDAAPTAPRPAWATAAGYLCFALCIAVALFGIVVIVFGKQMFH